LDIRTGHTNRDGTGSAAAWLREIPLLGSRRVWGCGFLRTEQHRVKMTGACGGG
jgi:hypothetical protein